MHEVSNSGQKFPWEWKLKCGDCQNFNKRIHEQVKFERLVSHKPRESSTEKLPEHRTFNELLISVNCFDLNSTQNNLALS